MNILDIDLLFEKAKFAKEKVIAYHVTDVVNLESILKHGLIPGKTPETGWGRGDVNIVFGYSYDPAQEGVYFTKNFNIVNQIIHSSNINPLIIVAQVEPRTAYLDEDELRDILNIPTRTREILQLDKIYDDEEFEKESEKIFRKSLLEITTYLKKYLQSIKFSEISIGNIIKQSVPHIKDYVKELMDSLFDKRSADISYYQEQLGKQLRHLVRKDKGLTFVIPGSIGYRGANKILGMYNPTNKKYWGDIRNYIPKRFESEKVEHPMELIK